MKKTSINPMPEFFDRYIALADDKDLDIALNNSLLEIENFPIAKWKAIGDKVYAPGKWTINQIFQHIIDTERIFNYRALCYARGEKVKLPSFDENSYAENADVSSRNIEELIHEFKLVRQSSILLFKSLTDKALLTVGPAYSALAIGFTIIGHQRWHIRVINERYL